MRCADSNIYAVILAGGVGERLWPVSRRRRPKYCLNIGSQDTLLQQAYNRMKAVTTKDKIFIVAQAAQSNVIKKQIPGISRNLITEPFGRNTAAAIGLAAVVIGRRAPDAVMVVVPADHHIPVSQRSAFVGLAKAAVRVACVNNSLVTVGVKPTYPATGFGYIKPSSKKLLNAYKVEKFVEKPDLAKAKKFLKSNYLWNAGIFAWEATAILQAIREYLPKLCRALDKIDKNFPLPGVYKGIDNISIDYGVLEKSKKVFVIPTGLKWDDVGSWLSFSRILDKDSKGNIINANFTGIDTKDSIVISDDKNHLIAAYGLKDLIIVRTKDVTLVCSKDKAENIKELVNVSDNSFR